MEDNQTPPENGIPPASENSSDNDLIAELKKGLDKNRLPPDLKAQILASLPPLEEQERLLRELQQNGGLTSEEFLASLGIEG